MSTKEGLKMRRKLLAIPAAAGLAVVVAIASGAFASSTPAKVPATATASTAAQMPMPMPASAAGAQGPVSRQLHRKVVRVTIRNFAFSPARVVVSRGTRIVWTNADSDPHTVTSDKPSGRLSSAALDTGGRYAAVVTRAGTITYHCTIHPYMHGVVTVQS
jgi:plastocyanin